jgi:hypothetical protein
MLSEYGAPAAMTPSRQSSAAPDGFCALPIQAVVLARPCSAPLTVASDEELAAQPPLAPLGSWPRRVSRGASMSAGAHHGFPSGGAHQSKDAAPNPFMAAANPFATAPPRAGGQPWSGPAVASPSPFASAAMAGPALAGLGYTPARSASLPPLPPAAAAPNSQPPNPFAVTRKVRCDWEFMEEPDHYDGDGFDSDTTDFCSHNARARFASVGGLGLFATDDQVTTNDDEMQLISYPLPWC